MMEDGAAVRAAFERDGFYIWRGLLDEVALAPAQRLFEEKVEAVAAALAGVRAAAGCPT